MKTRARIRALIIAHNGRVEMTHEEIAERIRSHRETVTRALHDTSQFARVFTGHGYAGTGPRFAYGLASDPPRDLRPCALCRQSTVDRCPACQVRLHERTRERAALKRRRESAFSTARFWTPRAREFSSHLQDEA